MSRVRPYENTSCNSKASEEPCRDDRSTSVLRMNQQLTSSNVERTEKRRHTIDFSAFNRSNKLPERSVLSSRSLTSDAPLYTSDSTSNAAVLLQEKENCPTSSNVETTTFSPPDWLLRRIENDTAVINSFHIDREDEPSVTHNEVDTDDPYVDFWVQDEIDKIKLDKSAFTGYEINDRCLCCWGLGSLVDDFRLCRKCYDYIMHDSKVSNIKLPSNLSELPDRESADKLVFDRIYERMQKRIATLNKPVKGYDYSKFAIDTDEPSLQDCLWCGKRSKRKSALCKECKKFIENEAEP
ncbi:hypothetical protein M3Y94_00209800 [Aphelenchoides besseyi]|nr:hypothetical protein M3Y94_00209800 [Aphelenchoides besseyi]